MGFILVLSPQYSSIFSSLTLYRHCNAIVACHQNNSVATVYMSRLLSVELSPI
jgi:hypothetical protein